MSHPRRLGLSDINDYWLDEQILVSGLFLLATHTSHIAFFSPHIMHFHVSFLFQPAPQALRRSVYPLFFLSEIVLTMQL